MKATVSSLFKDYDANNDILVKNINKLEHDIMYNYEHIAKLDEEDKMHMDAIDYMRSDGWTVLSSDNGMKALPQEWILVCRQG